ncbi:hypothetical protein MYX65_05850 [Acidobacteria bacterium AH-259-L09]|nr:hypothetical protein [Acidobacteria bacterium AH-259-L09]
MNPDLITNITVGVGILLVILIPRTWRQIVFETVKHPFRKSELIDEIRKKD